VTRTYLVRGMIVGLVAGLFAFLFAKVVGERWVGQAIAFESAQDKAAGMTGDPDPYTATMNALELFDVDDIVISTYSETRSGWLRADLIERARKSSQKPVKHITQPEDAQVTA